MVRYLFYQFVNSQELKDCVEEHVKHSGNLLNDILENLNDGFSLLLGNERFVAFRRIYIDILLTAGTTTAAVRPDAVALAAAEASLELSGFVLGAAAKIGGVKIGAVCTAVTAVRDLCAVATGTLGIRFIGSDDAEADREAGKNH